jgi:hypothetical protein
VKEAVKKSRAGEKTKTATSAKVSNSNARPRCIYVDNSNVFIGGQETAKARNEEGHLLRIAFSNFLFLITAGTMNFEELVWAGSGDAETGEIFHGLKERGVDVQIIPRSEGGEHETVDNAMQLAMYRHARKYRDFAGTMVLCSGDGKGADEEKGFLHDLMNFVDDGWRLELYSWDKACSQALKDFANNHGEYIPLDEYYESITFIKDGRPALPVKLRSLKKAGPTK